MQTGEEVIDVREVIKDLAVSKNDESAACHAAKELQQTTIPGPVNTGRSGDDDFHSCLARGFASDVLPFELRLLVNVAGPERRIFVCRRTFDVTMDADGAAVDNPFGATRLRRLDDGTDRGRVHRSILVFTKTGLPVDSGYVVDDVNAVSRPSDRIRVPQIAGDRVNPRRMPGVRP